MPDTLQSSSVLTKVDHPTLKRSLTLPLMVLYGLGVTIGARIYVLVGAVQICHFGIAADSRGSRSFDPRQGPDNPKVLK